MSERRDARRPWLAVVGLALAALIVAWFAIPRGAPDDAARDGPRREAASSDVAAQSLVVAEATPPGDQRQATAAAFATGSVRDVSGRPIAGATVSLVRLTSAKSVVDAAIASSPEYTQTDNDGAFEFRAPGFDPSADIGVIWASAAGHAAAAKRVVAPSDWGPGCRIQLAPATDVELEVVHADGSAAGGAHVLQRGLESVAAGARPYRDEHGIRSAFVRELSTDASGRLSMPRLEGVQQVEARFGELRSRPFVGATSDRLRLVLCETFVAGGRVRSTGSVLPRGAVVIAESVRVGLRAELSRANVELDGAWASEVLPAADCDAVVFRLEGEGLAPIERSIGRPRAGERYAVDFDAEPGVDAIVQVRTPSGEPCAGATVFGRWYRGGSFFDIERRTGADGIARVPVVVGLATSFGARVEGYCALPIGPFTYLEPAVRTLILDLVPSGRIRGRCVRAGEPVADFEVLYWQGRTQDRQALRINDALDGSFVIDDAPSGQVFLCAQSNESPPAETKVVEVVAGNEATVELVLGESRVGRGRIVDAASGEPLGDAQVQLMTSLPDGTSADRGELQPVRSDGTFELRGFPDGTAVVWIVAPSHAPRVALTHTFDRGVADFGVIPLARTQTLELRLASNTNFDFAQAWAQTYDSPLLPLRYFSADGRVVYEDIPPRWVSIQLTLGPNSSEILEARLVAGQPWVYTIQVDGGRRCTVRAVVEPGTQRPDFVESTFRRPSGVTSRYVRFDESGVAQVEGIVGDELVLTAYAGDWTTLGIKHYEIPAVGDLELDLPCGRRDVRARVFDAESRPISGARVALSAEASGLAWVSTYTTDASGECSFPGVYSDRVRLRASAQAHGFSAPVFVDVRELRDEPVVISLAGLSAVRVRLDDRGFACAGVALRVVLDDGSGVDSLQTDEAGRAITQPIGNARLFVEVDDIGYWPIHHALPYPRTDAELVVPLRRLGGVRFEARAPSGAAVPGTRIEMRSLEFGAGVDQWITEGKLATPSEGLTTDVAGELVLDGLPNGEYEWRATAPDGSIASGTTFVPPRARGAQSIVLGP